MENVVEDMILSLEPKKCLLSLLALARFAPPQAESRERGRSVDVKVVR